MSSNEQKYRHLNTHADLYSFGACGQNFGLNLYLRKSFDYASIQLPSEPRNIASSLEHLLLDKGTRTNVPNA